MQGRSTACAPMEAATCIQHCLRKPACHWYAVAPQSVSYTNPRALHTLCSRTCHVVALSFWTPFSVHSVKGYNMLTHQCPPMHKHCAASVRTLGMWSTAHVAMSAHFAHTLLGCTGTRTAAEIRCASLYQAYVGSRAGVATPAATYHSTANPCTLQKWFSCLRHGPQTQRFPWCRILLKV
jgi:hypothetical protein